MRPSPDSRSREGTGFLDPREMRTMKRKLHPTGLVVVGGLLLALAPSALTLTVLAGSRGSAAPNATAGKDLYTKQCVACHGATGKPIIPKCPNFADKAYQKSKTTAEMVKVTTDGKPPMMPPFKGK